jgi:type III restriction enzyme
MTPEKDYQLRSLKTLGDFLRRCSKHGHVPQAFFEAQEANSITPSGYIPVVAAGLSTEMPYVCLRVPTGGGKTVMAAYAVGTVKDELLHAERAIALWLVPSKTILDQTVEALRDKRHFYRRALDASCGGPVEVMRIDEALNLSRATADGATVVIVSTIQAFRVEDPTGRKVYDQNSVFAEHLLNVPADRVADLFPGADGKPKPSLVNALRLRRPIVIVDEAHNARTPLSYTALGALKPSCVIEFTATPSTGGMVIVEKEKVANPPSNVLHRVSAAELKAANMVKLPLRVSTRHPSQKEQLLSDALTLRSDLERLAAVESQETGEYLRPILLIQAERVDACEPLRERLVSEYGIEREHIKISTGSKEELEDIADISSAKCQVRLIITVQKLREGWDCPFAYVLCSLQETRSATAIEQIVGRVLRLPNQKLKQHPDLNCAYVFSLSPEIQTVLAELQNALENNGFTKAEAERIIVPNVTPVLPLGVQPKTVTLEPATQLNVAAAQAQPAVIAGKVKVDGATGAVTIFVPLSKDEGEQLTACGNTPEAQKVIAEAITQVREAEKAVGGTGAPRIPSPYEQQIDFVVPLLSVWEQNRWFEFESTLLLDYPWKLSAKDAALDATYDPTKRPAGKAGKVDVNEKGAVETSTVQEAEAEDFVGALHQQVLQLSGVGDWTMEELIGWLDSHLDHTDITSAESAAFLRKVIQGLMAKFGIADVSTLALDRFRLRDEIEARIQHHRDTERKEAFEQWLLPTSDLAVTDEHVLNFKTISYEPSWLYEGGHQFKKHYFGSKPGELREKRADGKLTEEFKCACFIDDMPEVKFWMRNLSQKKKSSFKLQTSGDWFYPDFVCQLQDGRILVVEYKGAHLVAEAADKAAVGAVWASRSKGKCLFVMPSDEKFEEIAKVAR